MIFIEIHNFLLLPPSLLMPKYSIHNFYWKLNLFLVGKKKSMLLYDTPYRIAHFYELYMCVYVLCV